MSDGLLSGSLDRHADALRLAQGAELRDTDLDAGRFEVLEYEICDSFGKVFDQTKALLCEQRTDVLHDHAIVDRVAHLSGLENGVPRESDLEVDLDRLWCDLFMAVEADPCRQAQLAGENGIPGGRRGGGLEFKSCPAFYWE